MSAPTSWLEHGAALSPHFWTGSYSQLGMRFRSACSCGFEVTATAKTAEQLDSARDLVKLAIEIHTKMEHAKSFCQAAILPALEDLVKK